MTKKVHDSYMAYKAKYDAWSKLKGTSQADAQKKYVDLVKKLGA